MFDLNYQQSHRGLQGPLPRAARVCGIQTGDSPVTSGSALEEGLGRPAPVGLGDIPAAAFLICWTWTPPNPTTPPPKQPLTGQTTRPTYSRGDFECVSLRGRWRVSGVPDGLMGSLASGLQCNSVASD